MTWKELNSKIDLDELAQKAVEYNIKLVGAISILDGRGGVDQDGIYEYLERNRYMKEYLDEYGQQEPEFIKWFEFVLRMQTEFANEVVDEMDLDD